MHLLNLPTNSSRSHEKWMSGPLKEQAKNPSHKNIRSVIITCYHLNGKTQHMIKFGQSFKRVLKQPMISIEFWGTFYNVPRPIVEKHHWIHPWPGIKRTSANLVNSLAHRSSCQKRPCPCCILRKRACGSSKNIFGETSLLFNTKKKQGTMWLRIERESSNENVFFA